MPSLSWLPESLQDIQRLYEFLEEKNPQAAQYAVRCIQTAARQVEAFPESGRPMLDNTGRREVYAAFGSGAYVLRYKLKPAGDPVVIRVWHSKELRV